MLALPLIGCSIRENWFCTYQGQHSRVVPVNRGTGEWTQKIIKWEGWPRGLSCSDVGKGKIHASHHLSSTASRKSWSQGHKSGRSDPASHQPLESGPCTNPGQHNRVDLVDSGARNTHGKSAIWWSGRAGPSSPFSHFHIPVPIHSSER